jgi:uncharacterized glyoxalase superfamily protein PhnB
MKPRITVLTLGVDDLEKATRFYKEGLGFETNGIVGTEFEHGAVAFFNLQKGLKLALYPRTSIAKDAAIPLRPASSGEFTMGHNVGSKKEVDDIIKKGRKAGAELVKPARKTFYGGYAGYLKDPDGHLWEITYNPHWASPDDT